MHVGLQNERNGTIASDEVKILQNFKRILALMNLNFVDMDAASHENTKDWFWNCENVENFHYKKSNSKDL